MAAPTRSLPPCSRAAGAFCLLFRESRKVYLHLPSKAFNHTRDGFDGLASVYKIFLLRFSLANFIVYYTLHNNVTGPLLFLALLSNWLRLPFIIHAHTYAVYFSH